MEKKKKGGGGGQDGEGVGDVEQEKEHKEEEEEEEIAEYTVAILKPDLITEGYEIVVLEKIKELKFKIVHDARLKLTKEKAKHFYEHLENESHFSELIDFITSGPVRILELESGDGSDAVKKWLEVIGPENPSDARKEAPESLRALYGTSFIQNAVHGSANVLDAKKEKTFFFPKVDSQTSTPTILKSSSRLPSLSGSRRKEEDEKEMFQQQRLHHLAMQTRDAMNYKTGKNYDVTQVESLLRRDPAAYDTALKYNVDKMLEIFEDNNIGTVLDTKYQKKMSMTEASFTPTGFFRP